ncbi:MAG: hypothetical protein WC663_01595 [Patescibacteria group bacterium]|jgi:hypothetical protein
MNSIIFSSVVVIIFITIILVLILAYKGKINKLNLDNYYLSEICRLNRTLLETARLETNKEEKTKQQLEIIKKFASKFGREIAKAEYSYRRLEDLLTFALELCEELQEIEEKEKITNLIQYLQDIRVAVKTKEREGRF